MTAVPKDLLHRARRAVLAACLTLWVAAFVITHTPRHKLPGPKLLHDNELHGLGYFVLTSAFWLTLAAYRVPPRRRAGWTIVVLAAYALLDEITQPLAGRQTDVFDWLADMAGVILAAAVCKGTEILHALRRHEP